MCNHLSELLKVDKDKELLSQVCFALLCPNYIWYIIIKTYQSMLIDSLEISLHVLDFCQKKQQWNGSVITESVIDQNMADGNRFTHMVQTLSKFLQSPCYPTGIKGPVWKLSNRCAKIHMDGFVQCCSIYLVCMHLGNYPVLHLTKGVDSSWAKSSLNFSGYLGKVGLTSK